MAGLRFSHVALNCREPQATEDYYSRNFGFRRARAIPVGDGEIVFLRCGDVYLELFAAEGGSRAGADHLTEGGSPAGDADLAAAGSPSVGVSPGGGAGAPVLQEPGDGPHAAGMRHLAFQVDDVDQHLQAMGVDASITLGPLNFDDFIPGWRTVWLRDPEGNIVEVSQGYRDQDDVTTREMIAAERQRTGGPPEERNIR